MRTSIDLDDQLMVDAKIYALRNQKSFKDLVSDSLKKEIYEQSKQSDTLAAELVLKLVQNKIINPEQTWKVVDIVKKIF